MIWLDYLGDMAVYEVKGKIFDTLATIAWATRGHTILSVMMIVKVHTLWQLSLWEQNLVDRKSCVLIIYMGEYISCAIVVAAQEALALETPWVIPFDAT